MHRRPSIRYFIATAYSVEGTGASGKWPHPGTVAADRKVLPLNSRIRIYGAGRYSGDYIVEDTGGKVDGIRDRALGFLPKPFTSDSLLQKVQNALNLIALRSDDPDSGGTAGEGCAGVVAPLLPRRPFRPPMAFKLPLPE